MQKAYDALTPAYDALKPAYDAIVQLVAIVQPVVSQLVEIFNRIAAPTWVKYLIVLFFIFMIIMMAKAAYDLVIDVTKSVFDWIADLTRSVFGWIADLTRSVFDCIKDLTKSVFDLFASLYGFLYGPLCLVWSLLPWSLLSCMVSFASYGPSCLVWSLLTCTFPFALYGLFCLVRSLVRSLLPCMVSFALYRLVLCVPNHDSRSLLPCTVPYGVFDPEGSEHSFDADKGSEKSYDPDKGSEKSFDPDEYFWTLDASEHAISFDADEVFEGLDPTDDPTNDACIHTQDDPDEDLSLDASEHAISCDANAVFESLQQSHSDPTDENTSELWYDAEEHCVPSTLQGMDRIDQIMMQFEKQQAEWLRRFNKHEERQHNELRIAVRNINSSVTEQFNSVSHELAEEAGSAIKELCQEVSEDVTRRIDCHVNQTQHQISQLHVAMSCEIRNRLEAVERVNDECGRATRECHSGDWDAMDHMEMDE